jgi:hypothetical protein
MRRFVARRNRPAHADTSTRRVVVLDPLSAEARRTRAALHRAGHMVLGADDARTALALAPSADVLVADPRGDDDLLRALTAALSPRAVLVLYTDPARPMPRGEPCRTAVLVARGELATLLETLAEMHTAAV